MNASQQLLSLKYTPKYFKDFEKTPVIELLSNLIKQNELNVIINGPLASGKTATLNAIINEYFVGYKHSEYAQNIMNINSIKEQGINYFRNEVKNFCQINSSINKKKVIFVDDIDLINEQCQQLLNSCIDKFANKVFFICSCSNIYKINKNLQSRLINIKLTPLLDHNIKNIIKTITTGENLNIDEIVEQHIRKATNNNIKSIIKLLETFKLYGASIDLTVAQDLCTDISFIYLNEYTVHLLNNDLKSAINVLFAINDKGFSVVDILDVYFVFIKQTELLTDEQKYDIVPFICKYISTFYIVHEDDIELALFTKNLISIIGK